jgi:hypothetical protein
MFRHFRRPRQAGPSGSARDEARIALLGPFRAHGYRTSRSRKSRLSRLAERIGARRVANELGVARTQFRKSRHTDVHSDATLIGLRLRNPNEKESLRPKSRWERSSADLAVVRSPTRTRYARTTDLRYIEPVMAIATKYHAVTKPIAVADLVMQI